MRVTFAVVLLFLAGPLVWGQAASTDSPYELRVERVTDSENVCVLLQRDGRYHLERVLNDKTLVYEGSISTTSLREVESVIGGDELRQLDQSKIPVHLVTAHRDELDLRIARPAKWQQLLFPDADSRKIFQRSIDPLLRLLDTLPTASRIQLTEDEGKNNCLPPRSAGTQLARREATADSSPVKAASLQTNSYLLRVFFDQLGAGEVKRTCAIVYPNGFYHVEKSREKHYAEGVYQPDVVNRATGKIKADVFEQFLDSTATAELRRLLDDPDLVASHYSNLPAGRQYTEADITRVFIPRQSSLQELAFTNSFGGKNSQTVMGAGGVGSRRVDPAENLISPVKKWLKDNVESRKAARLKESSGNSCSAESTQMLPTEVSSELAQVSPADVDSDSPDAGESIQAKAQSATSSIANIPPPAKPVPPKEDTAELGDESAISIRVATRMVLLDVIATDNNGATVADVRPTDIELQEDGHPQNIKVFTHTSSESTRGKHAAPQLPPSVYSNHPEYRQPPGPLVLLLLDGVNTAPGDQVYARRQMLNYIRTLKPDQRIAIFVLTTDLLLLQDFTSDPKVLRMALERYSSNDSLLLARGAPAMITAQMASAMTTSAGSLVLLENLKRFNQDNAINATNDRVRLTLASMQAIARAMIGYPGRKNLIWVSSGFPASIQLTGTNFDLSQDYTADLTDTAAILSRAQVAVYPVDARGLVGDLQEAPNRNEIVPTVQSSGAERFGPDELTRTAPLVVESHFAMEQVAHDTGGRAFYNVNNLASAMAAGAEDGSSYYTLGYYPENKNWDGKFRKVNIRSNRKDIKLRYRPGYYAFESPEATGPPDPRQEQNRLQELARAIKDPLPATGIVFWAHLIPPRNSDAASYVEFLVGPNSISFSEAGALHRCNLDFAVFMVAPNGQVSDTVVKNVDTPLPPAEYASVRKRGLPFRIHLQSLPAQGDLRLAVRDNRTGLLGTLTIQVPAYSTEAPK